jgi:hypothetical protein
VQLHHYVIQLYGEYLCEVNLSIPTVDFEPGSAKPILLDSIFHAIKCKTSCGAWEEEMTGDSQEFADYCAAMISELAMKSQQHDMPVLAYLLSMATHELNDLRAAYGSAMISDCQELKFANAV